CSSTFPLNPRPTCAGSHFLPKGTASTNSRRDRRIAQASCADALYHPTEKNSASSDPQGTDHLVPDPSLPTSAEPLAFDKFDAPRRDPPESFRRRAPC